MILYCTWVVVLGSTPNAVLSVPRTCTGIGGLGYTESSVALKLGYKPGTPSVDRGCLRITESIESDMLSHDRHPSIKLWALDHSSLFDYRVRRRAGGGQVPAQRVTIDIEWLN